VFDEACNWDGGAGAVGVVGDGDGAKSSSRLLLTFGMRPRKSSGFCPLCNSVLFSHHHCNADLCEDVDWEDNYS
jgi:hypothetical protein